MKKNIQYLSVFINFLVLPVSVCAEVEAGLSLLSDYVDRGVSNTDRNPALQGYLDYYHENGFYAGIWASNVDFDDGDEADIEVDYYIGYSGENEKFSWDVSLTRITYPGAASDLEYDSNELSLLVSRSFEVTTLTAEYDYSNDYFGSGDSHYFSMTLDFELPSDFLLTTQIGRQTFEDNDFYGLPDYTDWGISVSRSYYDLDFSLSWTSTDLSSSECYGGTDWCDSSFTFSVGKSFTLAE